MFVHWVCYFFPRAFAGAGYVPLITYRHGGVANGAGHGDEAHLDLITIKTLHKPGWDFPSAPDDYFPIHLRSLCQPVHVSTRLVLVLYDCLELRPRRTYYRLCLCISRSKRTLPIHNNDLPGPQTRYDVDS